MRLKDRCCGCTPKKYATEKEETHDNVRNASAGARDLDLATILALAAPAIAVAQPPANTPEALTTQHLWIGQPAPGVDLVTTRGETVSLGDYRGNKFVVLHFAASW